MHPLRGFYLEVVLSDFPRDGNGYRAAPGTREPNEKPATATVKQTWLLRTSRQTTASNLTREEQTNVSKRSLRINSTDIPMLQ